MERASLVGSAYKRRALVDARSGKARSNATGPSADERQLPERRGRRCEQAAPPISSTRSRIASLPKWRSTPARRDGAASIARPPPCFGQSEGQERRPGFLERRWRNRTAISTTRWPRERLASAHGKLNRAYQDLHKRVTATRMWASVYDTACLVLPNYASRTTGKERAAANELLAQLRMFAHPEADRIDR